MCWAKRVTFRVCFFLFFSDTYSKSRSQQEIHYKIQFMQLTLEYYYRYVIPPPLSIVFQFLFMLKSDWSRNPFGESFSRRSRWRMTNFESSFVWNTMILRCALNEVSACWSSSGTSFYSHSCDKPASQSRFWLYWCILYDNWTESASLTLYSQMWSSLENN